MEYDYNYDYSAGAENIDPAVAGGMMLAGLGILIFVLILVLIVYVYMAICLMKMARKTNTENRWMAWIPILNMVLLLQIGKKPIWWIVLFFVPIVNIVISILAWMAVAKELRKPEWLGVLMIVPVANLIIPGYLAFSSEEVSAPAPAPTPQV